MDYTKGDWKFEKSDLTIRSNDFKNGSQMGDYKGVIIADLKPALGCDYSDNVDLEHTGRNHAVPQTLANAQLIAAAPEMYEALKEAVAWIEYLAKAGEAPLVWRGTLGLRDTLAKVDNPSALRDNQSRR